MMVNCPACQGPACQAYRTRDFNQHLSPDEFRYFRCQRCGLLFLDPVPDGIGRFYSQSYYAIPRNLADLERQATRKRYQIDMVRQFVAGGRLLDIGPGHGAFAFLAKEAGYEVSTIELDATCCQFLRDVVGVTAIQSDDPAEVLPELPPQDVITLWHVIEHLRDPWTVLERAAERLAPGGMLLIATPNPDSLQFRRVFRSRWVHLDAPRHLVFLPARLLARRLVAMGLQPIRVTADDPGGRALSRYGWRASLVNLSDRRLARAIGWRAGLPLGLLAGTVERNGLRGSAYTAIFRKPAQAGTRDADESGSAKSSDQGPTAIPSDLDEMYRCLEQGDEVYLPSRFWETLGEQHRNDLATTGYENFKRTLASNYFTWLISPRNNQFRYLARHSRPQDWFSILRQPFVFDESVPFSRRYQTFLQIYTRLLWRFVERSDSERILRKLSEPLAGNPFQISLDGRLISQDLANSVLEYYSIREQFQRPYHEPVTIAELGPGYGRNAFVFLSLFPNCRYIIIDIPPALYVAQRYLSSLFPNRKIRGFQCPDGAVDIGAVSDGEIVFLLPHQASSLPANSVELFINISSLHEMHPAQIAAYLQMIDRLTDGLFYSKQWIESRNPYDELVVRNTDYPIPEHWRALFERPAKVQTSFFEALYTTR